MKRIIIAILCLLPLLASARNFAVVNEQKALESMLEYTDAIQRIDDISASYHKEYTRMSDDIDRKFQEYQLLQNDGSPSTIRERRIQEIQNMQKRAQQFLETAQSDLLRQREELIDPLKKRVAEVIRQIGIEDNFAFIFPEDAPLYYGAEVQDITDKVIERLAK